MQNPQAAITMENGAEIVLELYPGKAPNTVHNFIDLAQKGFYDGLIFHRVIQGYMIQGGCPLGTGTGSPGYRIKGEFSSAGFAQNDIPHKAGTISMARTGDPNGGGCQFFICDSDVPGWDGQYAAFGQVISGMDEVLRIVAVPTGPGDRPIAEEKMATVTVDTFGVDYPPPEIIPE